MATAVIRSALIAGAITAGCIKLVPADDPSTAVKLDDAEATPEEIERIRGGDNLARALGGEACAGHKYPGQLHHDWDPAAPLDEQLLVAVCHTKFGPGGRGSARSESWFVLMHRAFDDRHFDHLKAALLVVVCAGGAYCDRDVSVGQVDWYARTVDPAAVRDRLARTGLPADGQKLFLARLDAARQLFANRVAAMDARTRALYVGVPNKVRAARAAHWKRHADLWKRWDELAGPVDKAVSSNVISDRLVRDVEALRDEYVARCAAERPDTFEDCFGDLLGRPLTAALVRLAIAGRDPVRAHAESDALEAAQNRATAEIEIFFEQYFAAEAERVKHAEWQEARRGGADAATLASVYGDPPPIQPEQDLVWRPDELTSTFAPLLEKMRDGVDWASGDVKKVTRKPGGVALIQFDPEVSSWEEFDCVDTNRIDQITADGHIVYRQKCKHKRTRKEVRRTAAIELPEREAAAAVPGRHLSAVIDAKSRRGHLISVWQDGSKQKRLALRGATAGKR